MQGPEGTWGGLREWIDIWGPSACEATLAPMTKGDWKSMENTLITLGSRRSGGHTGEYRYHGMAGGSLVA
jgi:hypothetical protein